MRRTAIVANRIWLAVIGLVLIIGGLAGLGLGTGLLARLAGSLGLDLSRPTPQQHLFGAGANRLIQTTWILVVVIVVAVVLGLLAIAWLLAQVQRREGGKPLRLQDDPSGGLTRCEPKVINDIVEKQIEALSGVVRATAILRGTAERPDLTAKVTVDEGTDLSRLLSRIETEVGGGLAQALDVRPARLAVQFEVSPGSRSSASEIDLSRAQLA